MSEITVESPWGYDEIIRIPENIGDSTLLDQYLRIELEVKSLLDQPYPGFDTLTSSLINRATNAAIFGTVSFLLDQIYNTLEDTMTSVSRYETDGISMKTGDNYLLDVFESGTTALLWSTAVGSTIDAIGSILTAVIPNSQNITFTNRDSFETAMLNNMGMMTASAYKAISFDLLLHNQTVTTSMISASQTRMRLVMAKLFVGLCYVLVNNKTEVVTSYFGALFARMQQFTAQGYPTTASDLGDLLCLLFEEKWNVCAAIYQLASPADIYSGMTIRGYEDVTTEVRIFFDVASRYLTGLRTKILRRPYINHISVCNPAMAWIDNISEFQPPRPIISPKAIQLQKLIVQVSNSSTFNEILRTEEHLLTGETYDTYPDIGTFGFSDTLSVGQWVRFAFTTDNHTSKWSTFRLTSLPL
jgi:hypothetical protein